jgi:phosphoglycerate dehydrogenase-like enzyme
MSKVAVLDDWQGEAERLIDWSAVRARADLTFFREHLGDEDGLAGALAGFDIVLAMRERTRFSASMIARLPDLRLLTFTGGRNASVDTAACTAHRIALCNTGGPRASNGTAELALGLMLAAARHIPTGDAAIRAGGFQESVPPGLDLDGAVLGLVGLGKIGGRMAQYARALGMSVLAWSQNLTDERAAEAGATRVEKGELFARADVVSLHVVLSDRTRGIVGAAEIGAMKPGAILVNTSRGPLVQDAPLFEALRAGRIFAALDVYDVEPLPADHPLRTMQNTVLTPHLGYVTRDAMAGFYAQCAENIVAWLDGKPIRVMNPEVLG